MAEVPQKEVTPLRITEKQVKYAMHRHNGLSMSKAEDAAGIARGYGVQIERKLSGYGNAIEKLMPASIRVIKKLSSGHKVGEMEDIKGSDVIAANKMIWDRVAPIQSEAPQVSGSSFTQININVLSDSTIPQPPSIEIPRNE